MRYMVLSLLAAIMIAGSTGCHTTAPFVGGGCSGGSCGQPAEGGCANCSSRGGYRGRKHARREDAGPAGPPVGAVSYPYYTTRGPRDFLMNNPPSIGR